MSSSTSNSTKYFKYLNHIQDLFIKYENNAYMLQRLCYHITDILPATLDTEDKNHIKRMKRTAFLTNEQKVFVQVFLSKHQYYYLPNNNCFYQYNGKTYTSVTEDDIQYQLLSTISKDRTLMQWKHKTKINIIKQIKERHLFKSIPESETIQKIINILCPLLLTNQPNITNNFVTKYNESYGFECCRLINMNDTVSCDGFNELLNKYGLDLLCVATHYSTRYHSSDLYLQQSSDELINYTLYLKHNTQQTILTTFCNHSIVSNEKQLTISWKNMHFIWKLFVSKHSLPSMIYVNTLKKLLREQYEYNEDTDTFYNVTSKYLPFVSNFIQFWEHTINNNNNNTNNNTQSTYEGLHHEIEIDELCALLKKWSQEQGVPCYTINEHDILKILHHYYPTVQIIDNKYILDVQCSLWNKNQDIHTALVYFRNYYKESILMNEHKHTLSSLLIPFDEIYSFYIKYKQTKLTISKRYFEKYICVMLSEFIEFENFVSISWIEQ